ncbi:DUF4198 domain-containing protein [Pollutimonas bauzanensis]|uniref:Uncharacterized conserved protein, contains GH25 family domain n=1 Tax=Pollutimonas bauzanensis TaxID=658167 RepID=A0A1M5SQT1_9BURK|nr:DUF4198 domain-containing protein [Pollutimonas bauzanensis]SHH40678.1 Uncharacterized conserved protein, contains GH25 family domain [Pollutimonas bauzanensis]
MKRLAPSLLALALLVPGLAHSHDTWILPSATVLSGEEGWITVDAAVGNDKFFFNHHPLSLKGLEITSPSGKEVAGENPFTGKLRSGFDVHLTETGTYRIALVMNGVSARWKEDGKMKRWFGSAGDYAKHVPATADALEVQQRANRIETFVTQGKPSPIAAVKEGISLTAASHPNDLFAGEKAKFVVTIDGQPAKQAEVEIVLEGNRYRDALDGISLKTNDAGEFEVTWPQAGRYWVHTESSDQKTTVPQAKGRVLSYAATLEVLPQ